MITFNYKIDFKISKITCLKKWIEACVQKNGFKLGKLNYIFCDDSYLLKLNIKFLKHDTLTDVISFDYTSAKLIEGDVFISVERVHENAKNLGINFEEELNRVMIHGLLHYMGYEDKTEKTKKEMRLKENECLLLLNDLTINKKMFHVKHY